MIYLIFVGEDWKLSEKVQKELFKAGFKWDATTCCIDDDVGFDEDDAQTVWQTDQPVLSLNWDLSDETSALGVIQAHCMGEIHDCLLEPGPGYTGDYKIIQPHDIIEDVFALGLDGTVKPWETPPEGYRIVSREERDTYMCPIKDVLQFMHSEEGLHDDDEREWAWTWRPVDDYIGWRWDSNNAHGYDHFIYAVPESYKFNS